ncbi:hypothetical protein [Oceanobacillus sp. FSL H7-0719]|uniref:hypothetical protein n=1 Tax=Oceanobacillus sp. FSL H7-0719 TaxID=2954507 RepID=UPI00324A60C9
MLVNQMELESLLDSLKYGHGNIISKNDNYVLVKPMNTWDTNYRLYDLEEKETYLIDFGDVQRNIHDLEEYGGILFDDLVRLDIDMVKEIAWKIEREESNHV